MSPQVVLLLVADGVPPRRAVLGVVVLNRRRAEVLRDDRRRRVRCVPGVVRFTVSSAAACVEFQVADIPSWLR